MARIRTVKPEFWTHPIMGRIDDASKCLALALLNFADDEGYFLADPNLVRSSCRPFDDDSTITRRCLDHLVKSEWIEIRNHPTHGSIGMVSKFIEHQKIDRPKPSTIKEYFIDDDSTIDRRLIAVGMEGNGKEGKGMEHHSIPPLNGKKHKRQSKDEKLGAFPPEVRSIVEPLYQEWPKEGSEGAKTSPSDIGLFSQRISDLLDKGNTPDVLIEAARDYIKAPRRKYAAPQFFFGLKGFDGGDAPWVGAVRLVLTRRELATHSA